MRRRRLVPGILTIVLLSALLGTGINFSLVRRFVAGEFRESFVDARQYPGIVIISRAETEDLFHGGGAAFVDSRTAAEYAAGHIPGAINVPLDSPDRALADLAARSPREQAVVVYCEGGDCQTSMALARIMHDRGFRDIKVYQGGWTDWTEAGFPVEAPQ